MKLLVINGPNINMLGIREPDIYGNETYEQLVEVCHETAERLGVETLDCFQSNHEGALVDAIQMSYGVYDGIVINPAAYTHTSIALLDAITAVGIPTIEVHEGALVDAIQMSYGVYDGIVINPAAYTHTSIALLDAITAVGIPTIEVHISAIEEREAFRQRSYIRDACIATVSGEGIQGYARALELLVEALTD